MLRPAPVGWPPATTVVTAQAIPTYRKHQPARIGLVPGQKISERLGRGNLLAIARRLGAELLFGAVMSARHPQSGRLCNSPLPRARP